MDPADHYFAHGRRERRAYLRSDVWREARASAEPVLPMATGGSDLLPEGFNRDNYLALNPDLVASGVDPSVIT